MIDFLPSHQFQTAAGAASPAPGSDHLFDSGDVGRRVAGSELLGGHELRGRGTGGYVGDREGRQRLLQNQHAQRHVGVLCWRRLGGRGRWELQLIVDVGVVFVVRVGLLLSFLLLLFNICTHYGDIRQSLIYQAYLIMIT